MSKQVLESILGSKTIAFHAIYAKAIGSVPAAVMLSQGLFWQVDAQFKDLLEIEGELFFGKTGEEWYQETGVTEEQQKTAREYLRRSGIFLEKRAGLPAKMHYRIDIDALVAVISRYLSGGEKVAVDSRSKQRETTRSSSGKFRQQEAVNSGNIHIVESKESLIESQREGASAAPLPKEPPHVEAEKKEERTHRAGGALDQQDRLNVEAEPLQTSALAAPPAITQDDVIDHLTRRLNEITGRSFRLNNKPARQAFAARLKEGFQIEDFERVFTYKTEEWGESDQMAGNLNPITLTRPANFERYLQAANAWYAKGRPSLLPIKLKIETNRFGIRDYGGDQSKYFEKQVF